MRNIIVLGVILFSMVSGAAPTISKQEMLNDLNIVGSIIRSSYAPSHWKAKHIGWDLEKALSDAKSKVQAKSNLPVKEYRKIVRDLLRSTEDYHVGYRFHSTEQARLHFTVKSAEGRYFIVHIDREKLSTTAFPFNKGDELVSFAGKPVQETIDSLTAATGMGVKETDQALSELRLTFRRGASAMAVPQGLVDIEVKTKAGDLKKWQLNWDYTPEDVSAGSSVASVEPSQATKLNIEKLLNFNMKAGFWNVEDAEEAEDEVKEPNPYGVGVRKSYIPRLGTVIWESDKKSHFDAYIYRNKKGKLIGYLRIPHYGAGEEQFKEYKKVLKKYSEITEGLVIDQINNPGGSLFYIYALVSVMSDKPVYVPAHHITLSPAEILWMSNFLKSLDKVKVEKDIKEKLNLETLGGYPVTMQTIDQMKNYLRFVMKEWEKGKTLTDSAPFYGIQHVNPDQEIQFKQPVLFLVNELDFSGGDFHPAILQDNKLVTVMGTRTAGAGGYVIGAKYPNQVGLSNFSYTGSLAKRVNNQPIENLGVTPDIQYQHTVKDLQGNYEDYTKKINEEIMKLIKADKKAN